MLFTNQNKKTITVCIPTYKRPGLLGQLLDSIIRQNRHNGYFEFEISVVDNDKDASAKKVVDTFKGRFKNIRINYDIEPQQNIALTRNRTVRNAHGNYIAFIDDDEYAESEWLYMLLKCKEQYNCAAVFGPVLPSYPKETPKWIIKGKFFDRPYTKDGAILENGRTGNALLGRDVFTEKGLWFDEQYGLTGGEDTEFFNRVKMKCGNLVEAASAKVYENIEKKRVCVKWILLRSFRGGQGHYKKILASRNVIKKLLYIFARLSAGMLYSIVSLPMMLIGYHMFVKYLQKAFIQFGHVSSFVPYKYYEYKD